MTERGAHTVSFVTMGDDHIGSGLTPPIYSRQGATSSNEHLTGSVRLALQDCGIKDPAKYQFSGRGCIEHLPAAALAARNKFESMTPPEAAQQKGGIQADQEGRRMYDSSSRHDVDASSGEQSEFGELFDPRRPTEETTEEECAIYGGGPNTKVEFNPKHSTQHLDKERFGSCLVSCFLMYAKHQMVAGDREQLEYRCSQLNYHCPCSNTNMPWRRQQGLFHTTTCDAQEEGFPLLKELLDHLREQSDCPYHSSALAFLLALYGSRENAGHNEPALGIPETRERHQVLCRSNVKLADECKWVPPSKTTTKGAQDDNLVQETMETRERLVSKPYLKLLVTEYFKRPDIIDEAEQIEFVRKRWIASMYYLLSRCEYESVGECVRETRKFVTRLTMEYFGEQKYNDRSLTVNEIMEEYDTTAWENWFLERHLHIPAGQLETNTYPEGPVPEGGDDILSELHKMLDFLPFDKRTQLLDCVKKAIKDGRRKEEEIASVPLLEPIREVPNRGAWLLSTRKKAAGDGNERLLSFVYEAKGGNLESIAVGTFSPAAKLVPGGGAGAVWIRDLSTNTPATWEFSRVWAFGGVRAKFYDLPSGSQFVGDWIGGVYALMPESNNPACRLIRADSRTPHGESTLLTNVYGKARMYCGAQDDIWLLAVIHMEGSSFVENASLGRDPPRPDLWYLASSREGLIRTKILSGVDARAKIGTSGTGDGGLWIAIPLATNSTTMTRLMFLSRRGVEREQHVSHDFSSIDKVMGFHGNCLVHLRDKKDGHWKLAFITPSSSRIICLCPRHAKVAVDGRNIWLAKRVGNKRTQQRHIILHATKRSAARAHFEKFTECELLTNDPPLY
jgi:hypothetical protein